VMTVILQKALDVMSCWASVWQLKVSVEKCNMLHIGSCSVSYQYSMGHDVISHETQCKDRGVVITNSLSFTQHICECTIKAHSHRRANSILRCFVSRDNGLLMRAFVTYVRPILEYNSTIWSPSFVRDIEQLEKVQRRFTKRLRGMKSLSEIRSCFGDNRSSIQAI